MSRIFNLTPHEVKIGERVFPAAEDGNPARLFTHKVPNELIAQSEFTGVRVIEPYIYESVIGLPRDDVSSSECGVIVSQMLAEWLAKLDASVTIYYLGLGTRVYSPDTDKGAIRENGRIVGSTQLIFWMST